MTQITLVLPFALPPPALAPDLVRALQAPALAALLSRTSAHAVRIADAGARALPHEIALAQALGLERPAFAVRAMRGFGLDPAGGTWFIVNPAHIEIARNHLLMADMRRLGLGDAHARGLFDSAKPYFDETGNTLLYGDAQTWFMRADDWAGLDTATPDAATGLNLTDLLPIGPGAAAYRKLQNEVQMLWYEHPANREREARGRAAVNGFWPWAGAGPRDEPAAGTAPAALAPAGDTVSVTLAQATEAEVRGATRSGTVLATAEAPAWLSALAHRPGLPLADVATAAQDTWFCYGGLSEAAIATDWATWLAHMQRLDEQLFAPLLAALAQGRIHAVRLLLDHRGAQADFTTTKLAQRKFWRRPTLDRLLP